MTRIAHACMHMDICICRNILTASYDLNLSRRARSQKETTKKSLSNFGVPAHSRRSDFLSLIPRFLLVLTFFSLFMFQVSLSCVIRAICVSIRTTLNLQLLHVNAIVSKVRLSFFIASISKYRSNYSGQLFDLAWLKFRLMKNLAIIFSDCFIQQFNGAMARKSHFPLEFLLSKNLANVVILFY